jgi:hypothetical protein
MGPDTTLGQTWDYLGFDLVMDDRMTKPAELLADCGY